MVVYRIIRPEVIPEKTAHNTSYLHTDQPIVIVRLIPYK